MVGVDIAPALIEQAIPEAELLRFFEAAGVPFRLTGRMDHYGMAPGAAHWGKEHTLTAPDVTAPDVTAPTATPPAER